MRYSFFLSFFKKNEFIWRIFICLFTILFFFLSFFLSFVALAYFVFYFYSLFFNFFSFLIIEVLFRFAKYETLTDNNDWFEVVFIQLIFKTKIKFSLRLQFVRFSEIFFPFISKQQKNSAAINILVVITAVDGWLRPPVRAEKKSYRRQRQRRRRRRWWWGIWHLINITDSRPPSFLFLCQLPHPHSHISFILNSLLAERNVKEVTYLTHTHTHTHTHHHHHHCIYYSYFATAIWTHLLL